VDPQNFHVGATLYQKLRLFAIFDAAGPHFSSQIGEIWYEVLETTWDSLLQAKFCKKNRLRGIPLLGKFVPKINNFGDFGAVSPHFKSDNG